ncbi:hypothetical protein NLJ89_g8161 [Agrocybe chaxingu]|uniref:RlpA-like double-psi beta-barrel-protein domain-containing protein-containing protein n=1 Tax=Agrocybe chaxingu TaxID=84603 RepID=A0A9W8K2Y5_9AGAR|nr:hypothetical protein NLJ89_g8161 [Agrocybe chaxingu]
MVSALLIILPFALSSVVTAFAEGPRRMVHRSVAKRAHGDVQLFKRFDGTRWTFYDVGLGACGQTNVASDYIVALNAEQFGSGYPGPNCFKSITLSYNGKTATATIMDSCPGCPYGGLDLSRGLFQHFASEDVGVIYGSWSFNDGSTPTTTTTKAAAAATTTRTTTKAATTTTQATTSRTTPRASASTTTSHHSTTTSRAANLAVSTSSHASSSSTHSVSSTHTSSSVSSSSTVASATASASANVTADSAALIQENLAAMSDILTRLAGLIMAAGLGTEESD